MEKSVVRRLLVACVAVVLALALLAQPAHAQGRVHIVQRGETLWAIAVQYGTTTEALAQANGLANPRFIYAGQRLAIPAPGGAGGWSSSAGTGSGAYTVRAGDTLSSIAARHSTTVQAFVQANGLANANYIYPGQSLRIPSGGAPSGGAGAATVGSGGQLYTVRSGDTLSAIAYRYGTTAWAIASANGLANPSYIYPGQQLRIPSGSGAASAPAPVASGGGQRIVVDLSDQRMYLYQNGQLLWNWVVSTGRPGQETAVGHYQVQNKIPNAYASTWGLQMPYWLGIYWAGSLQNGIHALPIQADGRLLWDGYLGQRVSFGCVILSTQNAATLYNWAAVGTPVDVVW